MYHSENYKLNERIKEEHDCSNGDIQSDTSENIIDIDYHVTVIEKCILMNVIETL